MRIHSFCGQGCTKEEVSPLESFVRVHAHYFLQLLYILSLCAVHSIRDFISVVETVFMDVLRQKREPRFDHNSSTTKLTGSSLCSKLRWFYCWWVGKVLFSFPQDKNKSEIKF